MRSVLVIWTLFGMGMALVPGLDFGSLAGLSAEVGFRFWVSGRRPIARPVYAESRPDGASRTVMPDAESAPLHRDVRPARLSGETKNRTSPAANRNFYSIGRPDRRHRKRGAARPPFPPGQMIYPIAGLVSGAGSMFSGFFGSSGVGRFGVSFYSAPPDPQMDRRHRNAQLTGVIDRIDGPPPTPPTNRLKIAPSSARDIQVPITPIWGHRVLLYPDGWIFYRGLAVYSGVMSCFLL